MHKPCISLREHVDNDTAVSHIYAPFAHTLSNALTLQYDKVLYMLTDTATTRKRIGRYIDVYEYPDGYIELRPDGIALPSPSMTSYPR